MLLDLVHSSAQGQTRPGVTAPPAWLASCGTSYTGSDRPAGSSRSRPPLWRGGGRSPGDKEVTLSTTWDRNKWGGGAKHGEPRSGNT